MLRKNNTICPIASVTESGEGVKASRIGVFPDFPSACILECMEYPIEGAPI